MTSAIHGGRLADGKYSCAPSQGDAPPFYRQQHHPGWGGLVVRSRMRPGPRSGGKSLERSCVQHDARLCEPRLRREHLVVPHLWLQPYWFGLHWYYRVDRG